LPAPTTWEPLESAAEDKAGCHLKGELAFTTGRMLCSPACTPSALMLLRRCLPSAARSESDVPFPRKLNTRTAVSKSGKPAARLRSTAIPLRPSVANGKVVSGARAGLSGGRRIPVAAGIGLSWERRDAEQFQTGQGPPRAGAGESRRRHGDLGRECPRCLPWHTIGYGALRLGSQACHCGPGSAWPRAATRLVARLEQMAAAAGARRVILQTGGNQPEAEALYPKIA
jgi:hypothetical protein